VSSSSVPGPEAEKSSSKCSPPHQVGHVAAERLVVEVGGQVAEEDDVRTLGGAVGPRSLSAPQAHGRRELLELVLSLALLPLIGEVVNVAVPAVEDRVSDRGVGVDHHARGLARGHPDESMPRSMEPAVVTRIGGLWSRSAPSGA